MSRYLFILLTIIIYSCQKKDNDALPIGIWQAKLQINETEYLPFNFEVTSDKTLKVFNADEVILVNEIEYFSDSVQINMPIFEGFLRAKLNDSTMTGNFIKADLDRTVPFTAKMGVKNRFDKPKNEASQDVSGIWETTFSKGDAEAEYMAKGIFTQEGEKVTGTFRTTTGDYRYLEGVMDGDVMKLSTFDGAHAFLFTAKVADSMMNGTFYSGNHWSEPFEAKRNPSFELPDANQLTFLKEGYETLAFSFPDETGQMVSLKDKRFQNKVVVVQIMGSWCPNCLDETKYLSEFYQQQNRKDVEFVALAFEYVKTKEAAFERIQRLKDNLGIQYPILLAQYGTSDKKKAQEKLPMLNQVLSYPTTVIIDKSGNVRKIHTGFNGPATGEKYVEFKRDFEKTLENLIQE